MSGQNGKAEEKTDITQMAGVQAINDGVYLFSVDPEAYEGDLRTLENTERKRLSSAIKAVNDAKYGLNFIEGADAEKPFAIIMEIPVTNSYVCQEDPRFLDMVEGKLLILSDKELYKRANAALAALYRCVGEDP